MDRKSDLQLYFNEYRSKLNKLLDKVDIEILTKVIETLIDTFKNGNTVFICGNGGSAATASHIQTDFRFFVRHFTSFRPRVLALTDNIPIITAIGNDIS